LAVKLGGGALSRSGNLVPSEKVGRPQFHDAIHRCLIFFLDSKANLFLRHVLRAAVTQPSTPADEEKRARRTHNSERELVEQHLLTAQAVERDVQDPDPRVYNKSKSRR
jgi:hypothetical protein